MFQVRFLVQRPDFLAEVSSVTGKFLDFEVDHDHFILHHTSNSVVYNYFYTSLASSVDTASVNNCRHTGKYRHAISAKILFLDTH
jgi:hypothetical protein